MLNFEALEARSLGCSGLLSLKINSFCRVTRLCCCCCLLYVEFAVIATILAKSPGTLCIFLIWTKHSSPPPFKECWGKGAYSRRSGSNADKTIVFHKFLKVSQGLLASIV